MDVKQPCSDSRANTAAGTWSTSLTQSLMTTPEVADLLQVAEITLRKWRLNGAGPRFVRCGSNIRYCRDDIDQWIADRTVASTSQPIRG